MPKTTGHISHPNHDNVNLGETVRAAVAAAAAAQVVATVRKQRKRDEQLFSVHFLFLYNPGA